MARETAIAYGIEFYVGRRSRDRALSDIRAAGEMVNLQALRNFKQGAAQREKAHATAVKSLRDNSKTAIAELEKTRSAAAAKATAAFEQMKPLSPEAALAAGKIDTSQLDEYKNKFSANLRAMDTSLSQFADSASDLGMEFDGTDTSSIMEGFAKGDAQQRKAAIDDLDTRMKRRDDIIKSLHKEGQLAEHTLKIAKDRKKVLSGPKGELAMERAKFRAMKKTDKGYKEQRKLVNQLAKEQTENNKVIKAQDTELQRVIESLEEEKNLKESDRQLLRELKRLNSEITGEEIRTSKLVRENKQKERELDKQKREDDARAIQQLKEQNHLMQEYFIMLD